MFESILSTPTSVAISAAEKQNSFIICLVIFAVIFFIFFFSLFFLFKPRKSLSNSKVAEQKPEAGKGKLKKKLTPAAIQKRQPRKTEK